MLTDLPETTISTDHVDKEQVVVPQRWNLAYIRKFMMAFGLLSSVFDYLTFGLLIWLLKADETHFQTGWFIESVISVSLIVLVIRTRLPIYKSFPSLWLSLSTFAVVVAVILIPYSPLGKLFGFVPLPFVFFAWLLPLVLLYIGSAETMKRFFFSLNQNHVKTKD